MGCDGLKEMDTSCMFLKVLTGCASMMAVTGLASAIGGIVVLTMDCQPAHAWALLVWGLLTILLYGFTIVASVDKMQATKDSRAANMVLQGLRHITAAGDGASCWWFAKVLIDNYLNDSLCPDAVMIGFVLCVIGLVARGIYVIITIGMMFFFCFK